jgi:hypothetical protein
MSAREPWESGIDFMLTFVNRGGRRRLLGPLPQLRLDGKVVRARADGPAIAENCYSIETSAPVIVRFEGAGQRSRPFGPFTAFSIVDRLAYSDGRALALFNPAWGAWLCYDTGRYWPSMVVGAGIAA